MIAFRKFTRPEGRERITRCGGETAANAQGVNDRWKSARCLVDGSASELLTRIKYWRVSCRSARPRHAMPRRVAAPWHDATARFGKSYWVFNYGGSAGAVVHTYVLDCQIPVPLSPTVDLSRFALEMKLNVLARVVYSSLDAPLYVGKDGNIPRNVRLYRQASCVASSSKPY